MSQRMGRRVGLWVFALMFVGIMLGCAVISIGYAQVPTVESVSGDVNVLKYQVAEIQRSDLPAQVEAIRSRLLNLENAVSNVNRKQDEASWYYRLILAGVLTIIGHRLWGMMYPSGGSGSSTESGDGIPTLGRRG